MVRFLHLRFSCGFPCARVFPVKNTRNVAHSLSRDLCGRLCRKALRSPCLWEIGRQDRPKICVPSDDHYHGIRDDHHRPPSILPNYRSSGTRNSSFHSHATRACPRWGKRLHPRSKKALEETGVSSFSLCSALQRDKPLYGTLDNSMRYTFYK